MAKASQLPLYLSRICLQNSGWSSTGSEYHSLAMAATILASVAGSVFFIYSRYWLSRAVFSSSVNFFCPSASEASTSRGAQMSFDTVRVRLAYIRWRKPSMEALAHISWIVSTGLPYLSLRAFEALIHFSRSRSSSAFLSAMPRLVKLSTSPFWFFQVLAMLA